MVSVATKKGISPYLFAVALTFLGGPVVRGGGGGLRAGGCRGGGSGAGAAGGAARAVLSPRHRARLQLGGPRVGRTRHRYNRFFTPARNEQINVFTSECAKK